MTDRNLGFDTLSEEEVLPSLTYPPVKKVIIGLKRIVFQGVREHLAVYYISPQSFMVTISYSLVEHF